jgi:hypothetical protein
LIFLSLFVSCIAVVDWHLTRRAKQVRDEAWSFIHRQVIKVMWLLMAIGVLLTFATFFFASGYMIYAEWVVLFGIGLYVHGLFSEELLEWVGAFMIAVGISMVSFHLTIADMKWVAASTLGAGLILLSFMLDRGRERAARVRLLQSVGWLLCVLVPPLLAHQLTPREFTVEAPSVSYEQFLREPNLRQAVTLPAGLEIPVRFEVSGNLFRAHDEFIIPLALNEPLQIMMDEGKPTGEVRTSGGNWGKWHDTLTIQIPRITAEYDARNGAWIRSSLIAKTKQ